MRSLFYLCAALAVMALAFWAYRENYATQQALKDVSKLNREISALREAIRMQRAEWAYLNRPERLSELTAVNFDRLGLLPLQSEQFARPENLPMPPVDLPDVTDAVDVMAATAEEEAQP